MIGFPECVVFARFKKLFGNARQLLAGQGWPAQKHSFLYAENEWISRSARLEIPCMESPSSLKKIIGTRKGGAMKHTHLFKKLCGTGMHLAFLQGIDIKGCGRIRQALSSNPNT